VPVVVGRLGASAREGDELVAHVDEGDARAAAAQREVEQGAVELQGLVDVPDLQCDVVDADETRAHATIVPPNVRSPP
jgi:hypothetical protein